MNRLQTILHIDEAFHLISLLIFSFFSISVFTLMGLHYEKYVLIAILSIYCFMDIILLLKSYFNNAYHFSYAVSPIHSVHDNNYHIGKLNEIIFRLCVNMFIQIVIIFFKVSFFLLMILGLSAGLNAIFDVVENTMGNWAYLLFSFFVLTLGIRVYKDFLGFKKTYNSLNIDRESQLHLLKIYNIKDSTDVMFILGKTHRMAVGVKYKKFLIAKENFLSYGKEELDFRHFMTYLRSNGKRLSDMNDDEMTVYSMIKYP